VSVEARRHESHAETSEQRGSMVALLDAARHYTLAAHCWQVEAFNQEPERKPDMLRLAERNYRAAAACLDRVADAVARQSEITTRGN
jgi:hypothetical protein